MKDKITINHDKLQKMAKNCKKLPKIAKNCEFENNFSLIILNLIKAKNAHNIDFGFISDKTCYFTEIRSFNHISITLLH